MIDKFDIKSLTIQSFLKNSFETYGDKIAMSYVEYEGISYNLLRQRINSVCAYLMSKGVEIGDKVGILSENQPNWSIAFLSITSMGAVAAPIMQEFYSEDIHNIIREAKIKILFASEKYVNKLEGLKNSELELIIRINDLKVVTFSDYKNGVETYEKLPEISGNKDYYLENKVQESDIASLIYTSGTTGHSKGVLLCNRNLVANAIATAKLARVDETDIMLSILPLSHTIECTLGLCTPLIVGAAIYYLDKPPSASTLLPALTAVKPTIMLSIPLIIEKIFRQKIKPEFDKNFLIRYLYSLTPFRKYFNKIAGKKLYKTFGGRLKMFCIGGAPLPEDVELFLTEADFPYTLGYGLTETSPLLTGNHPSTRRFRTSGQPIEGVRIKIDIKDKNNKTGEILAKGPNVFCGYYNNANETNAMFTEDGWLKTGDIGYQDKDGYVYVKERIKNVIIGSNGKNIYPEEIESKLNGIKFVEESLVMTNNERLIAKVYLNYEEIKKFLDAHSIDGAQIKEKINHIIDNIHTEINKKVPSYSKITKIFEHKEPFIKTPSLKIIRSHYVY